MPRREPNRPPALPRPASDGTRCSVLPLADTLRSLALAASLSIDLVLKQKE